MPSMIVWQCSNCGKKLKADGQYAGRKTKCTGCGALNRIPGDMPKVPKEAEPPADDSFRLFMEPPRPQPTIWESPTESQPPLKRVVIHDEPKAGQEPKTRQKGIDEKFCSECGEVIRIKAEICPKCGCRQYTAPVQSVIMRSEPSPGVAAVLSLVIPGAGQMYKGNVGEGILWLIFVLIGYVSCFLPGLILHLCCIGSAASSPKT